MSVSNAGLLSLLVILYAIPRRTNQVHTTLFACRLGDLRPCPIPRSQVGADRGRGSGWVSAAVMGLGKLVEARAY